MPPLPRRTPPVRALLVIALAITFAVVGSAVPSSAENRVTPGDFTGYGFDQCLAPESSKMDRWMEQSPFTAVGIYISGNSRACRKQPNLTPEWISHQLANRWRLLPITLGPQASCQPRFPRYDDDPKISPDSTNNYAKARSQGLLEGDRAVVAAKALGITSGSTLWYDLEGFDLGNTRCRESALRFLHAWTNRIHRHAYVSGVYSSAGSGIKMLDDARVLRAGMFSLPDYIWIARWDGMANTSTSYIREDGWQPFRRMKQYQGGHNETWGGVTINIDSNFLKVGRGSTLGANPLHCTDVKVDLAAYPPITTTSAPVEPVRALQCLLRKKQFYSGSINGKYTSATIAAVNAWQKDRGTRVSATWTKRNWVQLLSAGFSRTVKYGSAAPVVRRLQRALAAATGQLGPMDGVIAGPTTAMIKMWQGRVDLPQTGVMNARSWALLKDGRYY